MRIALSGPGVLYVGLTGITTNNRVTITTFDSKGSVGVFADLRPAGLRWRLGRKLAAAFDPLSLAIVAPVLGSPGIVQLEYRTLLGFELLP